MNLEGLKQSVPGKLGQKFVEDQSPNWAVLIAWNALFAMFPIVLFAASILGLVLRVFGQANAKIYNTIFAVIPDDHSRTQVINAVQSTSSTAGTLSLSVKSNTIGTQGTLDSGSQIGQRGRPTSEATSRANSSSRSIWPGPPSSRVLPKRSASCRINVAPSSPDVLRPASSS